MALYSIIHTSIAVVPLLYLANKFNMYSIVGYMKVVFGSVGVEASRHSNFPFLLFSKTLRNVEFLGRIDPIFIVAWLIINIFRIVGFLYLATRAIRDVFNKTEKDRIILFIVCGISGLVSMLILRERSVIGIRKLFDLYYGILYVIFVIIIPILTIIVYFFRRKSINMKMESQSKLEDGKSK